MNETTFYFAWMDENNVLHEDRMIVTNFECDKYGFAATFESNSIWSCEWNDLPYNVGVYNF